MNRARMIGGDERRLLTATSTTRSDRTPFCKNLQQESRCPCQSLVNPFPWLTQPLSAASKRTLHLNPSIQRPYLEYCRCSILQNLPTVRLQHKPLTIALAGRCWEGLQMHIGMYCNNRERIHNTRWKSNWNWNWNWN